MKRFLQTILLACTMTAMHAQFIYSTVWTDFSPTYTLTSGISTTNAPGFLWSGYQPQINPGGFPWSPQNLNIFLRGFGPSSIWTGYKIYEGNAGNCTGSFTQIMDGVGVSMTEVYNPTSSKTVRYAMAGAYNNGCYFIGIDKYGLPIVNTLFPFQANTLNNIAPTKPVLVQDDNSTDFYMTGSWAGQIYVNRVDLAGNLVWSNFYTMPGTATPKDIVIYPNANGRVLITGKVNVSLGDDDGFVLDIEGKNGNVNNLKLIGNPLQNDGFNSIIIKTAAMPGAKDEILLGGFTETSLTTTESWLVNLDNNLVVQWSTLMQPTSGTNFGIVDLMERKNTFNNYEYYVLLHSASGMVVLKFDANFVPFVGQFPSMNEFVYNLGGTQNSIPACMSQITTAPTLMGLGIQVYGTAFNVPTANTSHMVQAYNNGETNCNQVLTLQSNPVAYNFLDNPAASVAYSGLSTCANFTTAVFYTGGAINFPCTGFIGNGNNARSMATAIDESLNEKVEFQVSPNPASSKALVTFNAEEGQTISLSLRDIAGREISASTISSDYSGAYTKEIDLVDLQLAAGVYFVDLKIGNNSQRQKLVVSN